MYHLSLNRDVYCVKHTQIIKQNRANSNTSTIQRLQETSIQRASRGMFLPVC